MPQELTRTQRLIIKALCKEQPQTFSSLAKSTGKSSKAVSEAAKLLEALGYATIKLAEDEPGRPKHVSLTAKGEAMCKSPLEEGILDKKRPKASPEEG